MPLDDNFIPMTTDELPSAPGIVMVCCPDGLNAKTARVIALVEAEDVRAKVEARAVAWATVCTMGYLEYFVALVDEPIARASFVARAIKQTPLGSLITKH